jgi:hypothetical protein
MDIFSVFVDNATPLLVLTSSYHAADKASNMTLFTDRRRGTADTGRITMLLDGLTMRQCLMDNVVVRTGAIT